MFSPSSFIILAVYTELQMQALGLYKGDACVGKDILVSLQRTYIRGGFYSGIYGIPPAIPIVSKKESFLLPAKTKHTNHIFAKTF